jgi:hypothetical protein
MRKDRIRAVGFSGMLLSVLLSGGCSGGRSGGAAASTEEGEHIKRVAGLVSQYEQATKKRPAKIDEVRDWAVKGGKASEDDFASTRDKEPYAIVFTTMGLVVHEQTGINGKCYMLSRGSVSEIPLENARQLVEKMQLGPGGKPKQKKG